MPYADPAAQRTYQREWMARRRADYLVDKACVVCGSTDRLEVDHIDPETKVSHRLWSWSAERRAAELAKCQVLCWDHHVKKTSDARVRNHGRSLYDDGCRCDICTTTIRAKNARRYIKT